MPNLNAIEQSAAELLRFQCLTLLSWTSRYVLCLTLHGIIFTKFDLRQLICAWIIAFFDVDTLRHAVTLIFNLLTLIVRGTSNVTWSQYVRNLSEIEQSPAELGIISRIFAHVISRCELDIWPLDLEVSRHFGVIRLNFVQNLTEIELFMAEILTI